MKFTDEEVAQLKQGIYRGSLPHFDALGFTPEQAKQLVGIRWAIEHIPSLADLEKFMGIYSPEVIAMSLLTHLRKRDKDDYTSFVDRGKDGEDDAWLVYAGSAKGMNRRLEEHERRMIAGEESMRNVVSGERIWQKRDSGYEQEKNREEDASH